MSSKAVFAALLVLCAAAVVLHTASSHEQDAQSPAEMLSVALLDNRPVYNERGEALDLVLPPQMASVPQVTVTQEVTVHTKEVLLHQIRESLIKTGVACSGPVFNAQTCSQWWEKDVTVYDMMPPNGVCRGRPEWEERLRVVVKSEPHDKMDFHVDSVGWVGGGTNLAWANGFWLKSLNGKMSKQGRYSAVMRQDGGDWRFFIASTIEMRNMADWTPVQHPRGGALLAATRTIMNTFAHGYNRRDYRLAFSDYTRHAQFPFMSRIGGTSLAFAVAALDNQKKKLTPGHLHVQVDDAQIVGSDQLTGVAHGFSKLTDASSKIYTMGKFSFLLILDRESVNSPWRVKYDFSPNSWLDGPTSH